MKRLRTVLALAMLLASAAARVEAVEWQRLGLAGDWYGTIAAVSLNDWIYTVERGGGLYRTNPYTGQWTQVGYAEFGNTAYLFAVGDWLYTIEYDGSLYRVSPGNGAWEKLGPSGGWLNTVAGVGYPFDAHSGAILTAESGGGLYATSTDGYWMQIGTPVFNNTLSMVVLNGWLYTIETSGSLYQVNPVNGSWRQIGEPAAWLGVIAAAALDGSFYTAESNGYLYQTNPETGERAHLGGPVFGDTTLMVAAAGALYTIENSGSLYRIDVSVPRAAGAGSAQVAPMTPAAMTVDTPAVPVGYAIQRLVSQRVDCVYRGEYDITGVHPQEWRFTTAMAPELPSQTGVRTRFTPDAKPAREYDAEQRLLLISHWPSTASHQTISIEYQATLWTRRLVPVYSRDALFAVTPLDEATRKLYLAPTYLLDYQSQPFQAWLDRNQLRRDRNQSEIDFGRRVFTVIVRQYVT
ncbi:MAG TPA: hypothetical protein VG713_01275, partial [Pirellulales bacterium]|nr:hypothetical protein [Pirellulales bacterium]